MSERIGGKQLAVIAIIIGLGSLVTVWNAGSKHGSIQVREEIKTAEQSANASAQIKKECFVGNSTVEAQINCAVKIIEAAQKNSREEQDLKAQKEMSFWALWMLLVTCVGVIFVAFTLYHTKRAADYTKGMLKQAEDTTSAAIAMLGMERAWVLYNDAEYTGSQHTRGIGHIHLQWKNSGKSPAIDCVLYTTMRLARPTDPIPTFTPNWYEIGEPEFHHIGPGESRSVKRPLPDTQFDALKNGTAVCYIFAAVRYQTVVSEETRETNFCAKITYGGQVPIPIPGGTNLMRMIESVDIRVCGPQNVAT